VGQWLLIFDNADDIDMWINKDGNEDSSPALKDYLPRSNQGCILFITRSRKIAVKLAQANVIEVSEMNEKMAELLLRKSLINQDPAIPKYNVSSIDGYHVGGDLMAPRWPIGVGGDFRGGNK
jgi:hypothetical protein